MVASPRQPALLKCRKKLHHQEENVLKYIKKETKEKNKEKETGEF